MAIESRQPKVNLLPPNLQIQMIDKYLLYFPTKTPVHGVVYQTRRKKDRRFMRFDELAKFCDGTLLYVYNGLKSRLLAGQIPKLKYNGGKGRITDALSLIEGKLRERLMLRRVEVALRLRTRTIREWDEYLQLSKWEPALEFPPPF